MTLRDRIKRLEQGQGQVCPECGHGGPGPMKFKMGDGLSQPGAMPAETCRQCGAVKSFTMVFDSVDDLPQDTRAALIGCGAWKVSENGIA